jgi:myo-inositol-1(or 4)-monophosphatase
LPETDLALLRDAAEAAAAIAERHFAGSRDAVEKPGGYGPVTQADLEIDRMLRAELRAARPDYGWLSEESENDLSRLEADRVFVVDPIDGTRAFVAGKRAWAHSLAVAERGRAVVGVVHLPMLARTYSAAAGCGANCNGATLSASVRTELDGADVLTGRAQLKPERWPGGVPDVTPHFRPSLAYRICLVAEGRFDAVLTFQETWEWDVAAGQIIAAEAGVAASDVTGAPLRFNRPDPVQPGLIVAPPALHRAVMARL